MKKAEKTVSTVEIKGLAARAMNLIEYGDYLDYIDKIGTTKQENSRLYKYALWVLENIYNVKKGEFNQWKPSQLIKLFTATIELTMNDESEDLKN